MYNSIYPININYRNRNQYYNGSSDGAQNNPANSSTSLNPKDDNRPQQQNTFPNGTRVAIDYSKGKINISQVLTDFRSTIIAINAPDDVQDEVNIYLNLTEKESLKENPSREIIVSNLKNASRIADDFIARTLKKPSNVVAGWIDALFLQNINLKSDPNEVNPDFLLEFPQKAQERIDKQKELNASLASGGLDKAQTSPKTDEIEPALVQPDFEEESSSEIKISPAATNPIELSSSDDESIETKSELELSGVSETEVSSKPIKTSNATSPFGAVNPADKKARELFLKAKNTTDDNLGDTQSLNLLNEALGILASEESSNPNIKAAIHLERGKIFDSYDYVDYALRDFFEATKASDLNLKANAFFKTGSIYDEFSEFSPALSNYLSSVAYLGEANNLSAQTKVLTKIAQLHSKRYDTDSFEEYSNLAIESALDTNNSDLIAQTYSTSAQNYQYLGENDKALNSYKNALSVFSKTDESFEQMAYNYEQAALVMERLGNQLKAKKLQSKANLYYQKAQQQQAQ